MSRIYRSRNREQSRISDVDFQQRTMGPQNPGRPQGGFHGYGGSQADRPMSHLERCEMQARRLVEEAQARAEAIQRDAYHAGFEQGERAGNKLALQKLEPSMQTFQGLIEAIRQDRENMIRHYEGELIKVAFAIALQVVKKTIEMDPQTVTEVVKAGLAKVSKAQAVKLKISTHDLPLVEQFMASRGDEPWLPDHLTIEGDPEIERGGCRIITDSGEVDATIETQLRMLKGTLWED